MNPKNLSIRLKVVVIVFVSVTVLTLSLYVVSTKVLLTSYADIEKEDVEQNLGRANDAIENRVTDLTVKLKDWAWWDDSYYFVENQNAEFIESNLQDAALVNLEMNLLMYLDAHGEILFKKVVDLETGTEIPSESIVNGVLAHREALKSHSVDEAVGGLISLDEGLLVLASLPVRQTSGEASNGTLMFGKFFDKAREDQLEQLTHLSVEIFPYNDAQQNPEDVRQAEVLLSPDTPHVAIPLTDETIAGYVLLYDVEGTPVRTLRVDMPRTIYKQGAETMRQFIFIAGASILLFGIFILLLLERFLVFRFAKLSKRVEEIGSLHDTTLRVDIKQFDEIGKLSQTINRMLDEITIAQQHERESRKQEIETGKKLEERLRETEKLNKLMVDREIKMTELKAQVADLQKRLDSRQ